MTMSDADINRIADAVIERGLVSDFEDNPPADLVYEPDISGYRSPGSGKFFLKSGGGRLREITQAQHDQMKGF